MGKIGRMEDGDISIMTWRQDSISTMPQQKSGEAFRMHWTAIKLFAAVMKRTDMQERFAYYLEQCIQNYFTEEKVTAAIEQLKALRDQELEANIEQKKSQDPTYSMSLENIDQNIEVIYDFVQQRPDMIRQQMQELYGIYMK